MDKFQIDTERLHRVAEAIGRGDGDLSECLAPDLKHIAEILARLAVLQDLAPGFLDEMFELWIPHFIKQRNKLILKHAFQEQANKRGLGDEFRRVIEAGQDPKKSDYLWRMVDFYIKATGATQADAIRAMEAQTGRSEDSIRRAVTRSKARQKK